jgi:hypothetical protein
LVTAEQFLQRPEAQKFLNLPHHSVRLVLASLIVTTIVRFFVTMKMKVEYELQYARSLDSGFGLAIGAREWNEGGAEKNARSRAAV